VSGAQGRPVRAASSAAIAVVAMLAAASCTAGPAPEGGATGGHGGTLTLLSLGPVATWDPQRMTAPRDMAIAGRLFVRTLTAYGPQDASGRSPLVADLATDTGTRSRDLRTWSFTLRDDARWQDGSPVTCADVRHGVARSFAPQTRDGPNDPLARLAVPRNADGTSTYAGPSTSAGQAGYDRAVSCTGRRVTFALSEPMADFNAAVSLPVFAPVKVGAPPASPHAVLSNGPYMLEGAWEPSRGAEWVRNPHWDRSADPLRRPGPERIRYQEGVESQTAAQRVMSDDGEGRSSVTLDPPPPALQQQIASSQALRSRSVNPRTGTVDYLAPTVTSALFALEPARQALAAATDRAAYVTALGGPTAGEPAGSLLAPPLRPDAASDAPGPGPSGDPLGVRELLQRAGLTLPVPIRVTYRSGPTADKAMAALRSGWEEAGFAVTLQPVEDDYYALISSPGRDRHSEVFWASWAPQWASPSTVLPPLFDSRLNLSAAGSGRDHGRFSDAAVNARMTAIATIPDPALRARAWAELDSGLLTRGVYVPLAHRKALLVAGSDVVGLRANEALGGTIDLATAGLR
jgi:peptide/nickel transport system substrate-binding protein